MNATPLEWFRLALATAGMAYIVRGAWQMRRDYRLLVRAGGEANIARLNAVNGLLRCVGVFLMWSVALLAVIYESFPSEWVIYSQAAYTAVIAYMVLVGRNIRKAQKS